MVDAIHSIPSRPAPTHPLPCLNSICSTVHLFISPLLQVTYDIIALLNANADTLADDVVSVFNDKVNIPSHSFTVKVNQHSITTIKYSVNLHIRHFEIPNRRITLAFMGGQVSSLEGREWGNYPSPPVPSQCGMLHVVTFRHSVCWRTWYTYPSCVHSSVRSARLALSHISSLTN